MTTSEPYVIVGAGHAAGQAATSLRMEGYEGPILLIGEEPYHPYQRPPLSKAYLAGELELERLYVKPPDFYASNNIETRLKTRCLALDRGACQLTLSDSTTVAYDKLLITTGTRVRELPVTGIDLEGVHYLRTIEDVDGIQSGFAPGAHLVVVGGGYIGLEVAAVAQKRGLNVTVVESEDRLLKRVVGEEVSAFFERVHTEEGVKILTGHQVSEFSGGSKIEAVKCANGTEIRADMAVVGIGIVPNQELAQDAGLACDNGILVDACCRTEDPKIFAAGDCTQHPNEVFGRLVRLESVHNALEQAKTAAAAMCGNEKPYNQVPWFWSDQYDLKLQIAGLNQGYDELVVRGQMEERKFAAFYLKDGQLLAVDAVNSVPEYMVSRKLIADRAMIPADRLADTSIPMKQVAQDLK